MFERDGTLSLLDFALTSGSGALLGYALYGSRGAEKRMGGSIRHRDGETPEGNAPDDVDVPGQVTFMISICHDDYRPMI